MEGLVVQEIQGNFIKYLQVIAEDDYCFYDKDDEERNYTTSITTPITDEQELKRKYIAIQGNADELNAELAEERLKEVEDGIK